MPELEYEHPVIDGAPYVVKQRADGNRSLTADFGHCELSCRCDGTRESVQKCLQQSDIMVMALNNARAVISIRPKPDDARNACSQQRLRELKERENADRVITSIRSKPDDGHQSRIEGESAA